MTILSKNILCNRGPFIQFADCPHWFNTDDPENQTPSALSDFVFYEMSDSLLGAFCSVTNTYSPFDCYEITQLSNPHDIRILASEFSMWTYQILRAGAGVFTRQVEDCGFYDGSRRVRVDHDLNGEHLRLDMIDTLLMLVGRFSKIARKGQHVVIAGI